MEPVEVTRSEIQEKIKVLVGKTKDINIVKDEVSKWLDTTGCSDFDKKQIMNDLTSYKEYLDLIN